MKNLITLILVLTFNFICPKEALKEKESINAVLSEAYSNKVFARGRVMFKNTESKECLYLYYDGTYKQLSVEDGYYTLEIQNPNKLNLLLVNPDSLSVSADEKEKNKVLGLVATSSEYQFYTLERENLDLEGKNLSDWKISENNLEKNADSSYKITANTLIIPIYNKDINLCLDKVCWKRDFNSVCLPTITVLGKKDAIDTTIRKACWLHLKIGQLHSEQKGKRHKQDNKEIAFIN